MICTKCGEDKPKSGFYKQSRTKSTGVRQPCKECHKPLNYIKKESKICAKCGEEKLITEFYKDPMMKDGHSAKCKSCENKRAKVYRKKLKNRKDLPKINNKKCSKCGETKPISAFYKDKNNVTGYTAGCIECDEKKRKEILEKDPDFYKKRWQKQMSDPDFRIKNKISSREYYYKNREKARQATKKWIENNKEKFAQSVKDWYKTENGKRLNKQKRANRRKAGRISVKVVREIEFGNIKKYGQLTCEYCHKSIDNYNYHLDHKIPVIRGGKTIKANLYISCPTCNLHKFTKTNTEFLKAKSA